MLNRDRTGKGRALFKKMALFRSNTSGVRRDVGDYAKGAFSGTSAATVTNEAHTAEEMEELLKVALRLRLILLPQVPVIGLGYW